MYGLELHWVNASPQGPTEWNRKDARNFQVVTIRTGQTKVIGRTSSPLEATLVNDLSENVFFPNAKVISRRHAEISWDEGYASIRDLTSTHGTSVSPGRGWLDAAGSWHHFRPLRDPLEVCDAPIKLSHGDLIQFGKECGTSESTYFPVRCYVRYLTDPPTKPRTAEQGAHRIQIDADDTLDSDSDVESLDAETFHASKKSCEQHSLKISDTSSVQIIEDDSEDEHYRISDSQLTLTLDASSPDAMAATDKDSDHSDSNSQASPDDEDQTQLAQVQEAQAEVVELLSESSNAEEDGDNYMLEYRQNVLRDPAAMPPEQTSVLVAGTDICKEAQVEATAPGTPAHEEEVTPEAAGEPDARPIKSLSEHTEPGSSKTITPSPLESFPRAEDVHDTVHQVAAEVAEVEDARVYTSTPDCGLQGIQRSLSASPAPSALSSVSDIPLVARFDLTRKRPAQDDDVDGGEGSSDRDDEASLSDADRSSASAASTGCTSISGSPPPSKRQRTRYVASPETEKRPAPRRLRTATKVLTTVLYTTSLLSIGFLGGSIFTFKSMMNAAAQMSTTPDQGSA